MPSLMLRGLDPDLLARVKAYARAKEISLPDGAIRLLELGLKSAEAKAAGARAVNALKSPEERTDAARKAALARWER